VPDSLWVCLKTWINHEDRWFPSTVGDPNHPKRVMLINETDGLIDHKMGI
jgi:hypothetical protein